MSSMVPRIGDVIADKYRIERRLGGGGMGTVFAATHVITGRRFAIKWMNARSVHDTAARERFIREFQAAGSIDHPNVVATLDVGSHDGTLYMLLEYLEGESLGRKISRAGGMPPSECVPIVVEAMRGVAAAHRLDIVHRDLKPDNIFVCSEERAGLLVKVLDFGVMKPVNARASTSPTITARGMSVGTPPYMAPEQVLALASLDHRVDIYSFGVILYEALTGRLPFADVTGLLLLERIVRGGAPRLSQFAPGVPIGLEATVMRALARDPRRRFQSLSDFAACLRPWAAGAGAFGALAPALRRHESTPDADAARVLSLSPHAITSTNETRALASESSATRPTTLEAVTPAPPSDATQASPSAPDAWATLAKGRESYPSGRESETSSAASSDSNAGPTQPNEAAKRAGTKHEPEERSGARGGRERKRRRRGRKKKEKAAVAAPTDAAVPAEIVATGESAALPPSASATDAELPAQGSSAAAALSEQPLPELHGSEAGASDPPPSASDAREDSAQVRAELPIEAALRRALAREGRLPLRHAWNTPDPDLGSEGREGGADNAFADLNHDTALRLEADVGPVSGASQATSQGAHGALEDAGARRSRVPTLQLRLQDVEALRAGPPAEPTDSRTASESAITAEMQAPRSSRISMHELSPWPEHRPVNTWSAPTEMAVPSPRMPAMRNRASWGLVAVATFVVCGIAWTQWDTEEDYVDSEQSVSAASDIFASNPDDPFAELAPSLADPPQVDDPTAEQLERARSNELAGAEDWREAYDRAWNSAASGDTYPTPNEAPAGSADALQAPASRNAAPRASDEPRESAAAPARAPSYDLARGKAASNYDYPSSIDVPTAAPAGSATGSAEFAVAEAAASETRVPEEAPMQAFSPAAGRATPAMTGKVVVVPAIAAMGPPEPSADAPPTPAAVSPPIANDATPTTAAPVRQASSVNPSTTTTVSASAPAPSPSEVGPPTQPIDGHAAPVRHHSGLLAPARAPEAVFDPAPLAAVAPPATAPRTAPFEYLFAGPSPLATSTPADPTDAPEPTPAAQTKPNAQAEPAAPAHPTAQPARGARAKPTTQTKSVAPPKPRATPKAAPGGRAKPAAATVRVTKLDVTPPNLAQTHPPKPNAETVDVPAPAARSGKAKPPRARKTSGVSIDDF